MVINDKFKESPYCKSIRIKFKKLHDIDVGKSKVPKLVLCLADKKNYVVYAKLLRYYIKLGLKVNATKILSFEENHG